MTKPAAPSASDTDAAPHIPVLIRPLIKAASPVSGRWLDGTFGAGGYTRQLLDAGADHVIGVDRDPSVFAMAAEWAGDYGTRLSLVEAQFSQMDEHAEGLDGVVLDLGVSSMQLDQAERGFSFMRDGPLDMRMGAEGPTAADLVNTAEESTLADILYHYGEERASRRIARAIIAARPLTRTLELAEVISGCLPRPKPGQSHPATRSFQAIRIAVNDEFGELLLGLEAAERALAPGGILAVVTFHSLEDRVAKRFFQARGGRAPGGSRYAPAIEQHAPQFEIITRKAIAPDEDELEQNPRARSARLRMGRRTDAPAGQSDRKSLGLPGPKSWYKE
ncbi:16S rRNA (cytosine(1402)-N(4))-methyltransferase RsmH [Alphaproteobacteria bacterium KMM 3653]|uniref:Ribosomal RNA small subunit methyltransferase H n=1 Tax=Harenicola maris TaxID=2841044 RepID=A0AAP2CKS3_9RHOB|nr:16S rRNA (cytosine(1402)-N(4))-methyltransferase RsmH [Harenicola maris]